MSNDAAWAESVQQFQQMLSQSWGNMLQAMQPGELNKAMAMPPSTPVNFAGDKLLELQQQYLQDMRALWGQGMLPQMPKTGDRRFAGENWAQNPLSVYSVTAYQMQARALMGMVDAVEADEKTRARIRFGVEQWLAAMSPSNFLAFNADAQKKAIETHGESIAKGVANLLHDMRQGHISMTDESRFEVGRNVATTEGAVVFENELFQLLEYKPLTAKVYERPFLMVPPCINKYYILDLQPENSVIRYAVSQGHRTFVISWRNPDESLGHKTWDDYIEQAVLTAIAKTQEISGVEKINALGFCVGGTMLTNALAVLAARGQDVVASATFLTTLINFADTGILDVFIDENFVRMREMQMGQGGLMKGQDLASTFSFLRPNELVWNYVVGNYLKGETPPPFDLLYWNSDSTNLPGPYYAWYLRNFYLENKLIEPGALTVCGEQLDLRQVKLPVYIYGSREDHIVPADAAYASTQVLPGKKRFVMGASGHIAGVINPPAKNKRSHWVREDGKLPATLQGWLAGADELPGSWWDDWSEWLKGHAGKQIAAPKDYGRAPEFKAIEPAPGRYVKQKA
ncbi:MAG: class I poly(R)-hydroxyalkanoic acid synthase [Alicycliphilus sp.]|jgi:polyhydroxyalkanoate synthase|uniref:Class I poly(R)-hydroxyalkanoic acid synthase n=1 Tax=Diaphorobacter limosus TaxID=3036128 RepID=A0ABZ0J5E3_9BURK|nr:class I poly(R)-hydroxyalkanoic acid synthase [Diaphorobacter sp. Y-1]MBP6754046.1 class I poly(R)-hydroxyalkanoic acid synthase [Alicycliphilus sp.]MCA0440267.1 class I poly(R)-hydroxyalkanoic acid synthase [Pseudomonadota bacterium]MBP7325514.1 class I poly(R)-hydroxyalkanoic acid synthase [Alicycliphilus sp.]MBP7328857.1 class I poly(R)-hydroxyalkanoic acid synthase [Alicycliphilus sp.]MBP8778801.1 class I poly(R)-hydroxyalkanoic acid synthase [Alicycliphilus sp.]